MNNEQLDRTIGLLGNQFVKNIKDKTIAVIGLGGVGGTALEALARTGFEHFVIVDFDKVNLSNLNRQILYTQQDIGLNKVEAAEKRLKAINDKVDIKSFNLKISEDSIKQPFDIKIDFIIDAIDDVKAKIILSNFALDNNIPFIMSLGMANRMDPSQVMVTRLDKTTNDPLARKIRHELKSIGLETNKIMAVCSKENPISGGTKLNSIMTVPSSAGLNIANYVISYFCK